MIEIVFGESACGSLKIAQTYGKGKYRGSAVSIFMRHEDGSVPSSDEMKKAQLQAQEQERIAWENAIPLGGKSCDVYCFDIVCKWDFTIYISCLRCAWFNQLSSWGRRSYVE